MKTLDMQNTNNIHSLGNAYRNLVKEFIKSLGFRSNIGIQWSHILFSEFCTVRQALQYFRRQQEPSLMFGMGI